MHDTLSSLVERAIKGQLGPLEFYLHEQSHLPGPRANLELANDVAFLLARASNENPDRVQEIIKHFVDYTSGTNLNNTPAEFIILCGVIAMGVCAASQQPWRERYIAQLNAFASSSLWRVREGVATAYQHLISVDPQFILTILRQLALEGDLLQQRAAVAAVAEPKLTTSPTFQQEALELQKIVLERLVCMPAKERKNENFRVLRRALGYTLSVVTAADPEVGFSLMRECAAWNDDDINWILRENLKKKRLARFKQDMASILELLK